MLLRISRKRRKKNNVICNINITLFLHLIIILFFYKFFSHYCILFSILFYFFFSFSTYIIGWQVNKYIYVNTLFIIAFQIIFKKKSLKYYIIEFDEFIMIKILKKILNFELCSKWFKFFAFKDSEIQRKKQFKMFSSLLMSFMYGISSIYNFTLHSKFILF